MESLCTEANERHPHFRRTQLTLQYYVIIKSFPANPAYSGTFKPNYCELFQQKRITVQLYELSMKFIVEELGISILNILKTTAASIQPWTINQPKVFLE